MNNRFDMRLTSLFLIDGGYERIENYITEIFQNHKGMVVDFSTYYSAHLIIYNICMILDEREMQRSILLYGDIRIGMDKGYILFENGYATHCSGK